MMDMLRDSGRKLAGRSAAAVDTQSVETTESVEPAQPRRSGSERTSSGLRRLVIGLRQGRRRERNITVETQKGFTVLYRCWVVELTFAWMSRCRRLAKDYERNLENSLAWAQLAACRFMMRRIGRVVKC